MSSLSEQPCHDFCSAEKRSCCRLSKDRSLKLKRRSCRLNCWVRLTRPATVNRKALFRPWAASAVKESWGSAFMARIIPYVFSRANLFTANGHEWGPRMDTNKEIQPRLFRNSRPFVALFASIRGSPSRFRSQLPQAYQQTFRGRVRGLKTLLLELGRRWPRFHSNHIR